MIDKIDAWMYGPYLPEVAEAMPRRNAAPMPVVHRPPLVDGGGPIPFGAPHAERAGYIGGPHAKSAGYIAHGEVYELTAPQSMTVEEAVLYSLDHHPRLRAREEQVEVARAALITAGLLPNPQIVIDTDTPVNEAGPTELSGRLEFTFVTGNKRRLAMAAAKAGVKEAEWGIDEESQLLLNEAAAAALEVLYLQEQVALEQELIGVAQRAAELERQRVQAGGATAAQAIVVETDAAEIEFDRLRAESDLAIARVRLSRALGLERPQELQVTGKLTVRPVQAASLDEVLAEVVRVRPELARAEATIERYRREAIANRAAAIPDFQLGPRYSTELGELNDSAGIRFGMDLPIFDRNQGDIYEADSNVRVNEALFDEVQMTSLHDVANAYLQLRPIEAALEQYQRRIVPLARQTEQLMTDPEALQALDPVDLSNQLRKLTQVRLKHLQLLYQHNLIRTQLELLMGRRIGHLTVDEQPPELIPDPPEDGQPGNNAEQGAASGAPSASSPEDDPFAVPPAQQNGEPRMLEENLQTPDSPDQGETQPDERDAQPSSGATNLGETDGSTARVEQGSAKRASAQVEREPILDASNWTPSRNTRGRFRR